MQIRLKDSIYYVATAEKIQHTKKQEVDDDHLQNKNQKFLQE
jgi:hypothetical protein